MRNITLPLFGQLLAQHGGHFAGIHRGAASDGSEDYVLIVSTAEGDLAHSEWGPYETVKGADSLSDGQANTAAMAAAGLDLALRVRALAIGGHTDWFIPAQKELQAIYAHTADLLDGDSAYWTSSQYSRLHAWAQDFEYGNSNRLGKDLEFRVRAVRKIQLQSFSA